VVLLDLESNVLVQALPLLSHPRRHIVVVIIVAAAAPCTVASFALAYPRSVLRLCVHMLLRMLALPLLLILLLPLLVACRARQINPQRCRGVPLCKRWWWSSRWRRQQRLLLHRQLRLRLRQRQRRRLRINELVEIIFRFSKQLVQVGQGVAPPNKAHEDATVVDQF
jgi:hypothetical protein